jgi:hypothetical protein
MKSILTIATLSFLSITVGYYIGQSNSAHPPPTHNDNTGHTTAIPNPLIQPTPPLAAEHDYFYESATCLEDKSAMDIENQLFALNVDDRLNALYFIWRKHLTNQYQNEIERLASGDEDLQVSAFAQWILGKTDDTEITETTQSEIIITDFNNPYDQLKSSLVASPYQYQHSNQ